MNLASGFYLFVLCSWLTAGAQVMPTCNGSCGAASSRMVSSDWLSTASDAANENATFSDRNGVERQIDETENALNVMKRPLDADEQKIAVQIRTYITRARKALEYDDLDGASTISNKARAPAGRTESSAFRTEGETQARIGLADKSGPGIGREAPDPSEPHVMSDNRYSVH